MGFRALSLHPGAGACWAGPGDRLESGDRKQDEGWMGQVGRTNPPCYSINNLFFNFLITKGETCPFRVTHGLDHLEKIRSIRKRAFKRPVLGKHLPIPSKW